ncbi:MAG: 3-dehydroquinate synthase [Planctomyces sp.]|nr:3-dehydroquinate synthase [Planctomyces sp.]
MGTNRCGHAPIALNCRQSVPSPLCDPRPQEPNLAAEPDTVHVSLGDRSYDILIADGILSAAADAAAPWFLRKFPGHVPHAAAIIADANVQAHAGRLQQSLAQAGWSATVLTVEPGETSKSLAQAAALYDRLVELNADRRTPVFAVGGGVVGDLAGFVATTFNRGLPFVQVPTTLLADVDSSVGGKVGINHPRAKNLIGAFHQPLGVLIDIACLRTLPQRELRSGLAEIVKYGVILDAGFFEWLERQVESVAGLEPAAVRHAIARSCRLKADVVEQDEFERSGLRAALNYGHTFAHAFEALAGYGELLHGEAVSIGMVCASRLAERLGRISPDITARQVELLKRCGLPTVVPGDLRNRESEILDCMRLDKKSEAGRLRFVLPSRLGAVELVSDVDHADVLAALDA